MILAFWLVAGWVAVLLLERGSEQEQTVLMSLGARDLSSLFNSMRFEIEYIYVYVDTTFASDLPFNEWSLYLGSAYRDWQS